MLQSRSAILVVAESVAVMGVRVLR
jgi:hypothetical protein